MSLRWEISKVDLTAVGLGTDADLLKAMILDHLMPKVEELLSKAKKFKSRFNYVYRWAKNQVIYLRHSEDSFVIKVKELSVLHRLAQEEMEMDT